jgi:hypothetical protein
VEFKREGAGELQGGELGGSFLVKLDGKIIREGVRFPWQTEWRSWVGPARRGSRLPPMPVSLSDMLNLALKECPIVEHTFVL